MHNLTQEQLFNLKYDRYSSLLYKIAYVQLGCKCDAEEVLQEVFIKLLYNAPKFTDDEHEKAWLIRVTYNKCRDLQRARVFRRGEIPDEAADPQTETDEESIYLRAIINNLPHRYRPVMILHYYEEYTTAETAKILNISQSAVKMRLKRGREMIKKELDK